MDKYLLALLCQSGYDAETRIKCQEIIKSTIKQVQIYQTIKEKELEYRLFAEDKLSKPGFWILTTVIASTSSQKLYLTGHHIMGIDSVNVKIGKESQINLVWSF